MRCTRPLLAIAVVGALAAPARAQEPAAEPRGQLVLAGGLDALLRDGAEFTPAPVLHAGYERRIGASRVGVRLAGDYFTQSRGDRIVRVNGEPVQRIESSSRVQIYGAGLLATYALARGRVQPYLIGGVGVQRLSARGSDASAPDGERQVERTSAALSGGLGLSASLGRVGLFTEARFTRLPNGLGRAGDQQQGVRGQVIPLTFGVRF